MEFLGVITRTAVKQVSSTQHQYRMVAGPAGPESPDAYMSLCVAALLVAPPTSGVLELHPLSPQNILLSIMALAQNVDSEHQQIFLNSCVMAIDSWFSLIVTHSHPSPGSSAPQNSRGYVNPFLRSGSHSRTVLSQHSNR